MIAGLDDWRGTMLARVRGLIKEADPHIFEELKWRAVEPGRRAALV